MIKIIEKIEGEAKLNFSFKDKKIDFVEIEFLQTRGIENILKNRHPLDSLVITPRVCGICGHAHLMATVRALEDCYEKIEISQKAKIIRELTLNFEMVQNHFKWFYLTIFPLLNLKQHLLKAMHPSQLMAKAIALFGGQYPHTSYAIVGGVVCEITDVDLVKLQTYIRETISFFEQNIVYASDAGMPGISDPGQLLVAYAQKNGVKYDVLPGANAFLTAFVASGFVETKMLFWGFLPHKGRDRAASLQGALYSGLTTLLYESPHRLEKLLLEIIEEDSKRNIFLAKELSKKFQNYFHGTAEEVLNSLNGNFRGEWVVVFEAAQAQNSSAISQNDILSLDLPKKVQAKLISKITGENIKSCYQRLLKLQ